MGILRQIVGGLSRPSLKRSITTLRQPCFNCVGGVAPSILLVPAAQTPSPGVSMGAKINSIATPLGMYIVAVLKESFAMPVPLGRTRQHLDRRMLVSACSEV